MNDAKLHTDLSQDWDETRPSPLETEMLTCWDWDETKTYKNVSRQWRLWPSIGTVAAYSAKYSALVTYKILELFQYWSLSVDRHVTITAKFELWCSLMETLCNVNMGVPTNTNLLDDYAWCSNIFCIYFLLSASGTYVGEHNGCILNMMSTKHGYIYVHTLTHILCIIYFQFSQLNPVPLLLGCTTCQCHRHFLTLEKLQEIFSAKVSVSIRLKERTLYMLVGWVAQW